MADLSILAGATSQSVNLFIQNSSVTTGAGLTGLVFNTASLTAYYSFTGANASSVAISLVTLATISTAWATGGFKEVDATNMPGWYRLDVPNAALASAKGRVVNLHLQGAANMAPKVFTIELTAVDNQSTSYGLTLAKTTNITGFNDIAAPTGFAAATFPSGTIANTTNITGGTIATATNLTNLPSIPSNWITAAGITAAALNGKGDWNIGKTGYALTQTFPTNFSSLGISVGGHISNVDTLTTYTGDTPQTGDSYARIGAAGAGLTALGDTRIANLDAAVSTRTKPADTQAAVTTVTNLTNAPTVGDFTATMKTSLNTSTPASITGAVGSVTGTVTVGTNNDKTGYALTSAYDFAKGTVAMTEAYAAKNGTLTPAQALYGITQQLGEQSIGGTTMTVKKRDQSTTAKTYTLNDATTPTAITEAS